MNAEEIDISGTVSPALLHALGQLLRGLALARRDLGLLDADTAIALEAACKRLAAGDFDGDFPNAAGATSAALLAACQHRLAVSSALPLECVRLASDPEGVVSAAVHLAAIRALRLELLPALYRLVSELQPLANDSPEAAAHVTLIERTRRRVSAAAETLREVALADPPQDPRFSSPDQQVAARALGFVNEAQKVQLKVASGALRPGGTWDAALDVLATLWVVEIAVAEVVGQSPPPPYRTEPGAPWPRLATNLLQVVGALVRRISER